MPSFKVSGKELFVSTPMWERLDGPRPPEGFECDGCSNSPDSYRSFAGRLYKLWPACVIHDYHYRTANVLTRDAAGRRKADKVFRSNLRKCISLVGGSRFDQERLAWLYWGRVRMWGASSFRHWAKGAKPTKWLKRLREVW